jgi:DtxR family transcriptional regulator, Mn-dependent transcriptional regulator
MFSQTEENYLKALFILSQEKNEVTVNELSHHLTIKMPTVNSMMKKLAQKKLVHYESYKPLRLTEKGKREAGLIIRKHRLTEMFLVEKMKLGWEDVHNIAEQIEHIDSDIFFDKMDELLGYPTTDPHGSPIPDKGGKITWRQYTKLSDCKPGDTVRLAAVTHSADDFLRFLNSRELKLGVRIKIKTVESFDGSLTVSYGKGPDQMLSRLVAEKLLVEKVSP